MQRDDLVASDAKLFTYKVLIATFIVVPILIVAFKDPHHFLHAYLDLMLYALSWPVLALVALYILRRRFLARLSRDGRHCHGVVQQLVQSANFKVSNTNWTTARVAVRIDGQEKIVNVIISRGSLEENAKVEVLVEPRKMRKGVLLTAVDRADR